LQLVATQYCGELLSPLAITVWPMCTISEAP
jgi:hypothetical protein